jgi:hypothetical protein
MAIVWCHKATMSMTRLCGDGLESIGAFISRTKFYLIERIYWTNLESFGESMMNPIMVNGKNKMKSWSSLNIRKAIV